MLNHSKADPIGILKDVLCQFHATKTSLNTEESDSDDEEDYGIQRNRFGAPMKIYVWKKTVNFLGSLPVALQHEDWKQEYTGNYCKKEEGDRQWHTEIRLIDPYKK
ncbi:hypothetical protein Tco_0375559 [Tanacetum coccineum]